MNLIPISKAAQLKGVSKGDVVEAIDKKIHSHNVEGVSYIITNRAFENWKPKRRE